MARQGVKLLGVEVMHDAIKAQIRLNDIQLSALGFDAANRFGRLGSYMEMMNRGGSGGYKKSWVLAAKKNPGKDPLLEKVP